MKFLPHGGESVLTTHDNAYLITGDTTACAESPATSVLATASPDNSKTAILMSEDAPTMTPGGVPVESMSGEWWALNIRGGVEKAFADHLGKRGIDYFLPLWKIAKKKRETGRRWIEYRAAATGYIFLSGSEVALSWASEHRDFKSILSDCLKYEVRVRLRADLINLYTGMKDWPKQANPFRLGQKVEINKGVWRGTRGTLIQCKEGAHFVVAINTLGREVPFEVDPSDVDLI